MRPLVFLFAAIILLAPQAALAQSEGVGKPSLFIAKQKDDSPETQYRKHRERTMTEQGAAQKPAAPVLFNKSDNKADAPPIFNMREMMSGNAKYGMQHHAYPSCASGTCRKGVYDLGGRKAPQKVDDLYKLMAERDKVEHANIEHRSAERRKRINMVQDMLDQDTQKHMRQAEANDAALRAKRQGRSASAGNAEVPSGIGAAGTPAPRPAPLVFKKKETTDNAPPKVFISNR